MKIEIIAQNGNVFKTQEGISINVMTKAGEITVLSNHSSLITALVPGVLVLTYKTQDTIVEKKEFAIGNGILEVSQNHSKILIDMLVGEDEIDIDLVLKAKQEALDAMEKYKDSKDKVDMEKFIEAEDMLFKSLAQLKLGNIR